MDFVKRNKKGLQKKPSGVEKQEKVYLVYISTQTKSNIFLK